MFIHPVALLTLLLARPRPCCSMLSRAACTVARGGGEGGQVVRIALTGDVMLARGVDAILQSGNVDPTLHEVHSKRSAAPPSALGFMQRGHPDSN